MVVDVIFFLPYTRCITPNLVTNWRCPISALLHLQATQLLSQKCRSGRELPAIRATENFLGGRKTDISPQTLLGTILIVNINRYPPLGRTSSFESEEILTFV